jgi:hypothetical protein
MNYYIFLTAIALVALLGWLAYRHFRLKRNYDRFLEISAGLLLAKDTFRRNRTLGSVIFELERAEDNVKEVQITAVRGVNNGTVIREFGRLAFLLDKNKEQRQSLCSVSLTLDERALGDFVDNSGLIYIKGIVHTTQQVRHPFAAILRVRQIDRS